MDSAKADNLRTSAFNCIDVHEFADISQPYSLIVPCFLLLDYVGKTTFGVDLSNVEMDIHDSEITITLPPAKILAIKVDETSLNASSLIASVDGRINHNPITASDQTAAIHAAQEAMQAEAENNTALLQSAQGRAKSLIDNYISQLAELSETPYSIVWNFT